jgi:hypothetical protein
MRDGNEMEKRLRTEKQPSQVKEYLFTNNNLLTLIEELKNKTEKFYFELMKKYFKEIENTPFIKNFFLSLIDLNILVDALFPSSQSQKKKRLEGYQRFHSELHKNLKKCIPLIGNDYSIILVSKFLDGIKYLDEQIEDSKSGLIKTPLTSLNQMVGKMTYVFRKAIIDRQSSIPDVFIFKQFANILRKKFGPFSSELGKINHLQVKTYYDNVCKSNTISINELKSKTKQILKPPSKIPSKIHIISNTSN